VDIIDNFLDKTEFKHIQKIIMSTDFPWYYNSHVSDSKDVKHFYYFFHLFFKNEARSPFFSLWKPFLKKLDYKALIRIKGGLYPSHPSVRPHHSHVDYRFKHKGCLFYINSNDGPTVIENKTILPKENRAVFFDSSIPHNSSQCSDQQVRVTVSFNYF
tara:strand:- start:838 stop:1311 length:474 start_codon:yes stop_codon:yes gene_type:complete